MSNTFENYPVIDIPFLYKYGLTIQNSTSINGTLNPASKLSILAGVCRDSNDVMDIRLGDNNPNMNGTVTSAPLRIDNTITGAGGIDSGQVIANTMYAIYIIADSRGYLPISAVATLGINIYAVPPGPTMPMGYDAKRLIGFWATASDKTWQNGYYYGLGNDLIFTYDSPQLTSVTAGTSTSYANVSLYNFVPLIQNIPAFIYSVFTPGAAGDTLTLAAGLSTSLTGQVVITGQVSAIKSSNINSVLVQNVTTGSPIFPLPSPTIQYKVSGTDTVAIYVSGFGVSL